MFFFFIPFFIFISFFVFSSIFLFSFVFFNFYLFIYFLIFLFYFYFGTLQEKQKTFETLRMPTTTSETQEHNWFPQQFLNFRERFFKEMGTSFRKFSHVFAKGIIQVAIYPDVIQLKSAVDKYVQTNYKDHVSFCKFLQGFALFIFSFRVFCFCFFWLIFKNFFINLFYFGALREQTPYFLALCKKTNSDFFGTSRLFWHFARTFRNFWICKNANSSEKWRYGTSFIFFY